MPLQYYCGKSTRQRLEKKEEPGENDSEQFLIAQEPGRERREAKSCAFLRIPLQRCSGTSLDDGDHLTEIMAKRAILGNRVSTWEVALRTG
jgi:hypothetical protein